MVLRAEKHTVSGRVTSVEDISDLQVVVHTPSEVKTIALAQADTQVSLLTFFVTKFGATVRIFFYRVLKDLLVCKQGKMEKKNYGLLTS